MIRVLIAEDSPTARQLLVSMLQSDPDIRVVGEARTGAEAVVLATRLAPDLITMDVQMPELDGLTATQQIMANVPTPIIIVSAQADLRQAELSLEATRAGALLVLPKPTGPSSPDFESQRSQLVTMAKAMAQVKVVRRWRSITGSGEVPVLTPTFVHREGSPRRRLVAIAASTGGPAALREIFAILPRSFPAPILVVQHIAKGFVDPLVHWLSGATQLTVVVARHGERARPGFVHIAPDDRHLGVRATSDGTYLLALSDAPLVGSFRPSGTHLFESVAAAAGDKVFAAILTGMGDDGVAGLRAVDRAGGHILAQDEASSVIHGMPREAIRAGVVDSVASLGNIAQQMMEAVA
jgi:two-component system chemotaxis response regulator CheB